MTLDQVISKLGAKFIYITDIATTLHTSHALCKQGIVAHTLLYGPGGHAKTQIARGFLQMMYEGERIFDKTAIGAGTTIFDILGFSIPEEMMKGHKAFQYEYGFMAAKAALFDELLDAPANVLEQLKAAIMDAEHCVNGVVCYKSNCEFIIACTNHEVSQWILNPITGQKDNSRAAVLDRFPYRQRVIWQSYTANDYSRMFATVLKDPMDTFARMMEMADKAGKRVSPRSAVLGAQAYQAAGLSGLIGLDEIDNDMLKEFKKVENSMEENNKFVQIQNHFEAVKKQMNDIGKMNREGIINVSTAVKAIDKAISGLNVDADRIDEVAKMNEKLQNYNNMIKERSLKLIVDGKA